MPCKLKTRIWSSAPKKDKEKSQWVLLMSWPLENLSVPHLKLLSSFITFYLWQLLKTRFDKYLVEEHLLSGKEFQACKEPQWSSTVTFVFMPSNCLRSHSKNVVEPILGFQAVLVSGTLSCPSSRNNFKLGCVSIQALCTHFLSFLVHNSVNMFQEK